MGKHRKKNHHGADTTAAVDESLASTQLPLKAETPQTQPRENVTSFFHRMRAEQKAAAAAAAQRLAAKKAGAEAERVTRFYQQATEIGQAQFDESNALMYAEAAERGALQKQMRQENPETVRVIQQFVRDALNKAIHANNQQNAERNCVKTQEMLHRSNLGDKETQKRLSMWEAFQKPSVTPTQKQRIAERNKDATAELRRRTEVAKSQRAGLFTRASSPTFDVVGNDETQQQSTTPQPKRWL